MKATADNGSNFSSMDEEEFKAFHWRVLLTTGMGVFCDGYDLSSIGIVLPLVLTSFGVHTLTGLQSGLLVGSALFGSAIGAMVFGLLAQYGRKRFYGIDVMIMGLAAIAQAFAPNLAWLIAIRFILGIGIGGDYVLSPTIMAEHANRTDRGKIFGLGFGVMWPSGVFVAGLLNLLLNSVGVSPQMQWHLVLAFGAVPAFGVLFFRRQLPETARYLARIVGDAEAATDVMRQATGQTASAKSGLAFQASVRDDRPFGEVFARHARMIFSAALLWLIYDLVDYFGTLFGPSLIARSLSITPVQFTLLLQGVFVIPSALVLSCFALDRLGRKPVQTWGFVVGAIMLTVFALLHSYLIALPALALIAFGFYAVGMSGPYTVSGTGILGVELCPTRIRTLGQAMTVVGGRVGASITAIGFPLLFGRIGLAGVIGLLAAISLLGAILTQLLIPETSQRSLEAINGDRLEATLPIKEVV